MTSRPTWNGAITPRFHRDRVSGLRQLDGVRHGMASLRIATLLILISAANAAPAQAPQAIALTPSEMVFSTDGLALPGMGQVNLVGDPTKPGPYTVRLQFPDGYRIDAHQHPDAREVTILSGTYMTGYGSVFDPKALKELPAGSFYTEPAGDAALHHHPRQCRNPSERNGTKCTALRHSSSQTLRRRSW